MGRKSKKGTSGLYQDSRSGIWQIDKRILGIRICESSGTRDKSEAELILARRIDETRQAKLLGVRPTRTWREAATEHLRVNLHLASIADDASHLKALDRFIGDTPLDQVHMGSLQAFIDHRRQEVKSSTINRALEVVRKILNQAAGEWIDPDYGLTWLAQAPKIKLLPVRDSRPALVPTWAEQRRLLQELPDHLVRMVLFKVNTGTRETEVCQLKWEWEHRIKELDRSVFIIPAGMVKNWEDRLVVCNGIAQSVIDSVRGQHAERVFAYKGRGEDAYRPISRMNSSAWRKARIRAGLPTLRIHDLKHTFGRRLRAAGVPLETRKVLLGHRNGDITVHYSAAEIAELVAAVDRLNEATERKVTLLRVVA